MSANNSTPRSVVKQAEGKSPDRWRRSQNLAVRANGLDGVDTNGSHPTAELERILTEYACECYAVGRGESMYYLVEDLPRLAREAANEIQELQAFRNEPPPWFRVPGIQPLVLKRPTRKKQAAHHPLPKSQASNGRALEDPGRRYPALKNQVLLPGRRVAQAKGTAKTLVAALPFIAVLAVIGLTIGLTFREFVGG